MNLNRTPLEVLILLVVSLSICAWMRRGHDLPRLDPGISIPLSLRNLVVTSGR
jgi:hypothetical protein